jgi:signal transduction histidine kinase/CheY-like chemotaxis protein/HPt (histidine-containing phosphotransfer) domain-containing protein
MEQVDHPKPAKFYSLSSKFSIFIGLLLMWVVAVVVLWDIREHQFDLLKGVVLCVVVILVGGAISRITVRLLARPLTLLQQGITSVRQGKFEPIQVSRTHDEIEYLGESFNRMIEELATSQEEIHRHGELLEERIHQRTEDLEKAMRAALAASQAKSEFLANMSHELRTPMNGLLGMLDVVLDSRVEPEQRDHLETAQRCAYSLLALLNDILDLSKIEAGKMMLEHIPFNVRTVLEDCVKSYHATATQKKIGLHFEVDLSAPTQILGDPLRLRQVAANLLSNAVKFTDRGWVCLRLSAQPAENGSAKNESGSHVNMIIDVSDTGPGIEADKVPFIFDKFTQADGSITRKYGGTGLGLAITRRLTGIQGGQVQVESKVGKGSTFSVTIPCELVKAPPSAPAERRREIRARQGASAARVLLVEDNLVNQKVVMAILRKQGFHIDVANDGREALTKLEASGGDYHLVLMDIQMPVLDGLETTRAIRRDPRWQNLPIIAMTAHAMNGDRERCLQAGMNAYISKPVQPAHLVSMVETHLTSRAPEAPAHPASAMERALIDRLMQGDSAMVNDLLHVFLQLAPERLERLGTAADQGDADTLSAEAKNIAAAAEQLTCRGLGECAQRIEQAAARGDFETVKQDLETLRQEIRSLEALTTETTEARASA